ncbi:MAG: hypothetical protein ACXWT4_12390, partial [Methylobacter sp.]
MHGASRLSELAGFTIKSCVFGQAVYAAPGAADPSGFLFIGFILKQRIPIAVCLREEFIASIFESTKSFIVFAIQDFFLEELPKTFNQVQI